ncbi:MAG: transcription elongation factor GreA [Caldisericia bacterium]|nr:transcription elongation factor GreA [Caldisericia bacterium]
MKKADTKSENSKKVTTKKTSVKKTTKKTKTTSKNFKSVNLASDSKEKHSDIIKLTVRGLEILKSELKELKTVKRSEISERIRQARALGDLSENSEYEDAKREQAVVEARISELENMLRKSVIVDENRDDDDNMTVRMGHSVQIESIDKKEKQTYTIVSVLESDPFVNLISNDSPLGSALIGHQVGNVIRVVLPNGDARYRILDIQHKEN